MQGSPTMQNEAERSKFAKGPQIHQLIGMLFSVLTVLQFKECTK